MGKGGGAICVSFQERVGGGGGFFIRDLILLFVNKLNCAQNSICFTFSFLSFSFSQKSLRNYIVRPHQKKVFN